MKVEIMIPTHLGEVPLVNYQRFKAVVDNSNDMEFIGEKMVEYLCGLNISDVLKLKWNHVVEIVDSLNKIFENKPTFRNTFEIKSGENKIEFGFIPDLENISHGEYIDLDSYIKDAKDYHKAMAVMYRPIIKKRKDQYEIEEYVSSDIYSDLMKFAPTDVMLGALVFFCDLRLELHRASLEYLKSQRKWILAQDHNSTLTGAGMDQSIQLLTETLQSLKALLDYRYEPVLLTSHTRLKKTK